MKKYLILFLLFALSINANSQDCSDLFISEYVEGSGNNKALEIYNPTSNTIDLSAYMIIRYSNGSNSATPANAIQLTGSVLANDVHVGVIEKLNPSGAGNEIPVADSLQAKADAFYCADYNTSNAWYWNGNDAIVLAKGSVDDILGSVLIDVFGKVGEDPVGGWNDNAASGYTSSGYSWTEDHTLIRKSTVLSGDIDPSNLFNTSLEWDSLAEDSWNNLGSHICNCSGNTSFNEKNNIPFILYPNPINKGGIVSVRSNFIVKQIILTNILGKQVFFVNSLNTSGLAKGTYIVDIEFSDGKLSQNKLIIN
jgi:hypothetical protein|tara:strand:+ start:9087 stop:10013 length:927 start_codon:yes stop_codon:yes gene_type:complete